MATDYFYAYGIRIGGRTLEEWLRELPAGTYAAYLETDTTVKDFPVTLKPGVHIAVTVLDEIRQTGTTAAAVITVPSAAASDGKAHIVLADITPAAIVYTETGAGGGGSGIEIVNDLTTGGTDKALSAEMGKQLNADFNTLDQKIDSAVTELETQDTALGSEIAQIEAGLQGKQDTLVSGTNIKTVNGSSVLGAGNIETADTKVTAIALTTDSAGAVTGGTATLSDGTQVQITVTQQTV